MLQLPSLGFCQPLALTKAFLVPLVTVYTAHTTYSSGFDGESSTRFRVTPPSCHTCRSTQLLQVDNVMKRCEAFRSA